VVVDPQVDGDVVEPAVPGALADHQQGRGLPPPTVAAGPVTCLQHGQEPAGQQRLVSAALPGLTHRGQHLGADEHVATEGRSRDDEVACPRQAVGPGVGGRSAVHVHDGQLPVGRGGVVGDQPVDGDRGRRALVQQGEGQALPADVGVGLGRQRADAGDGGGHHGADREELGGDGHAPRRAVR
jgi:hypothetical protein